MFLFFSLYSNSYAYSKAHQSLDAIPCIFDFCKVEVQDEKSSFNFKLKLKWLEEKLE